MLIPYIRSFCCSFNFSQGHPKKIMPLLIHVLCNLVFLNSEIYCIVPYYLFSQLKKCQEANNQPHVDWTVISNQCTHTLIMRLAGKSIVHWIFQADSRPSVSRRLYLSAPLSGCIDVRFTEWICVKYCELQGGKGVIETQRRY